MIMSKAMTDSGIAAYGTPCEPSTVGNFFGHR